MKWMRRFLALALACLLLAGTCAGCAKTEGGTDAQETGETEQAVETGFSDAGTTESTTLEDAPSFKFGFIHTSFSDQLGIMYQKYAQYAADQLGCEIIFTEATDTDSRMAAVQNMIEMGCQGIINTTISESMLQLCEDAGVYYIQVGNTISDPELAAFAADSEFFLGSCLVDNYQVGRNMVDALYEQGCRKLAFMEFTPGTVTTMDDRADGMHDAAEAYSDLEIVTEYTGAANTFGDGAEQILASYGAEIDGIVAVMANASIAASIYSYGLSDQIKYAGVDIQEGTDELLEAGTMAYVAGGAFPNAEIAVAMLYNYLTDYKIWTDDEDITRPLIELQSVEDYDNYMKYFEGDLPCYTGDELKTIVGLYNPDVTMEDVRALAADSSIESCVERHAGLIE